MIPCQLPYLLDPDVAADEVRHNAERGFKAVTFSEGPHALGPPSLHSGHWDPLMRACEETGTVVNLHIGSSGTSPSTSSDAPADVIGVLFFGYAMFAAVDWLYSLIPVKFPDIRICLSEGGIGWVPALLDRLDHMLRYHEMYGTWTGIDLTPAEVMRRNFWFCAVEDPSAFAMRDRIGVDKILLEADYPHCDSTWPDTQAVIEREIGGLPAADIRKITWENASRLYRHPVPAEVQADPNAF
jgi:predicted TIM-barrel fold metal-dependent hydrolase